MQVFTRSPIEQSSSTVQTTSRVQDSSLVPSSSLVPGSSLPHYLTAMALANRLLKQKVITRKEFLAFEKSMQLKYGLPEKSIYRDLRLLSPSILSGKK